MKKLISIFVLTALLSGNLQAQQTGAGASTSSNAGLGNNWQNWAFAGSAMVTAACAIFVVSMHNGQSSTSH